MKKSRLIELISAFNDQEKKQLQLFIQSPYFVSNRVGDLLKLFSYIRQCLETDNPEQLQKKQAYQALYPGQGWIEGKLDKLMSELLKVTHSFIGTQFARSDIFQQEALINFLQTRNLQGNLKRVVNTWDKKLHTTLPLSSYQLYENFVIEQTLVQHQIKTLNTRDQSPLVNMMESLDQFYLLTKLEHACQILVINLFVAPIKLGNSLKTLQQLETMIALPQFQIPTIQVYYQAYLLLCSNPDKREAIFKCFKKLLYRFDDQFTEAQRQSLHTMIRNYAILQYHNGHEEYLTSIFELYKDHLKRGFLYYQGKLLPTSFGNLVAFGLRLKEFDWVRNFLLQHETKIVCTEDSSLIYRFNLAQYYFHLQDFEKATHTLPIHFKDLYYRIASKRLEIKILYHENSPILESRIEAFKIFVYRLSNQQIDDKQKKANNKFVQILRQIMHPKTLNNEARINKIRTKIYDIKQMPERDWLLQLLV